MLTLSLLEGDYTIRAYGGRRGSIPGYGFPYDPGYTVSWSGRVDAGSTEVALDFPSKEEPTQATVFIGGLGSCESLASRVQLIGPVTRTSSSASCSFLTHHVFLGIPPGEYVVIAEHTDTGPDRSVI